MADTLSVHAALGMPHSIVRDPLTKSLTEIASEALVSSAPVETALTGVVRKMLAIQ